MKNCTILSPKTPKRLLHHYKHLKSTKTHFGRLMKLYARWVLPAYPVLNDQSHWKMCEYNLKNTAHQYSSNSSNCKKKIGAL